MAIRKGVMKIILILLLQLTLVDLIEGACLLGECVCVIEEVGEGFNSFLGSEQVS